MISAVKAKLAIVSVLSIAALSLPSGASAATLLGSTVEVTARYPNVSTLYSNPGPVTVSDSLVEYPASSFPSYNRSWQVDIFGDYLTITDLTSSGLPFGGGVSFNGFVLDVLSGPAIVTASIDNSSTIVPVSVFISDGDLFMNFSGVSAQSGGTARINFATASGAVPEPSTWAMLLLGFFGIGGMIRSQRRKQNITVSYA